MEDIGFKLMIHPKPYLSFTQYSMWKRSPEKYIEIYWKDGQRFTSREMAFGKAVADCVENDEESGDPLLDLVIESLPKLEKAELELNCELKGSDIVVPLYGKLDHGKLDLSAFREFKTGRTKWNQRVVDADEQITWYCTMIYIITGKIPQDVALAHAPTERDSNGRIVATGDVFVYPTRRNIGQILNMMVAMRKTWREIGERCEAELV